MKALTQLLKSAGMILVLAMLFTACEKDTSLLNTDDQVVANSEATTRVANHALPLKVHFNANPTTNPNPVPGVDPNGWLGGQATYFGNLQSANCPYWYLGPPQPSGNPDYPNRVYIFNNLTAANGDLAVALGYLDINPLTGMFIGHFDVMDNGYNTGRFVGVAGYADITENNPGYVDPNTGISYWDAEGEITFQ